jgi:hypothetical protein
MKILVVMMGIAFISAHAAAEGSCAKDRESFCAGVQSGEGRIVKCLKDNEEKLSAECKSSFEKTQAQRKEIKLACHDDAETLCPGMNRRELLKCLRSKKDEVSEKCRSEWKELKEMRKGRR